MADLARTPLYDSHRALSGKLVPFAGWEMPIQYSGIVAEHQAVRQAAGLFDVSHMGRLELRGADALTTLNEQVTNDLAALSDGRAQYTCACNDQGGILDDLMIYRHSAERLLVVCNASNLDKIATLLSQASTGRCQFENLSSATALIALQGPRALEAGREVMPDVNWNALDRPLSFVEMTQAGAPLLVARTGYTGEDGVEIMCPASAALELWQRLLAATSCKVTPVGLGARDTLRLEARLSLYGNDLDESINPLEAGLGWVVKLNKTKFRGKQALEAIKQAGVVRKLVGFEMTGRGVARPGYRLLDVSGNDVGVCTSGSPSPTLKKAIGLGFLPPELSQVGTVFTVDCRGKAVPAKVVKTPFYKRPAA